MGYFKRKRSRRREGAPKAALRDGRIERAHAPQPGWVVYEDELRTPSARALVALVAVALLAACDGGGRGASVDAGSAVRPPAKVSPACVKPGGAPVAFSVLSAGFIAPRLDAGSVPPGQRIETVAHQGVGGSVRWVVETATEIVIGFQAPAYCGGAAPPTETFRVVLPASKKPARVQMCIEGGCSGLLLP